MPKGRVTEIVCKGAGRSFEALFCVQAAIATKIIEKDTVLLDAYSAIDRADLNHITGVKK